MPAKSEWARAGTVMHHFDFDGCGALQWIGRNGIMLCEVACRHHHQQQRHTSIDAYVSLQERQNSHFLKEASRSLGPPSNPTTLRCVKVLENVTGVHGAFKLGRCRRCSRVAYVCPPYELTNKHTLVTLVVP